MDHAPLLPLDGRAAPILSREQSTRADAGKDIVGTLHSRNIAERLTTLASLLEAEAIRVNTLGLKGSKVLAREAMDVRRMANQLWDADTDIILDRRPEHIPSVQQALTEPPTVTPAGLRICS